MKNFDLFGQFFAAGSFNDPFWVLASVEPRIIIFYLPPRYYGPDTNYRESRSRPDPREVEDDTPYEGPTIFDKVKHDMAGKVRFQLLNYQHKSKSICRVLSVSSP